MDDKPLSPRQPHPHPRDCHRPSLEARGERLASQTIDRLEALLSDTGVSLINPLARARRVSPHHLALGVPGLCHAHGPDRRHGVPAAATGAACAYCLRRGNCFAARPGQ